MEDKYHILLVEDDEEIRSGIEIYLKNQGYEVYKAGNGAEGLKVLETETIHLAILDIMMPFADKVFTIAPNNPRALSAEDLATEIKLRGVTASSAPSVREALHMAVEASRKDSVILSFGSLYYLGEMIQAVNEL